MAGVCFMAFKFIANHRHGLLQEKSALNQREKKVKTLLCSFSLCCCYDLRSGFLKMMGVCALVILYFLEKLWLIFFHQVLICIYYTVGAQCNKKGYCTVSFFKGGKFYILVRKILTKNNIT